MYIRVRLVIAGGGCGLPAIMLTMLHASAPMAPSMSLATMCTVAITPSVPLCGSVFRISNQKSSNLMCEAHRKVVLLKQTLITMHTCTDPARVRFCVSSLLYMTRYNQSDICMSITIRERRRFRCSQEPCTIKPGTYTEEILCRLLIIKQKKARSPKQS